ncbi:MAG: glycosyltransferase [Salibacteraceae bacterium]
MGGIEHDWPNKSSFWALGVEKKRPEVLFVTTDLPFPANSGGRIKTFRLVQYLAQQYDVKFICAYGGSRLDDVEAFRKAIPLKSFQAFRRHLPRTLGTIIKAFMFSPTLNAHRIENKELTSMIEWSGEKADVVIIDHLEAFHLLPETFKGRVIYHSHNAEFKLWREFASMRSGLGRLMLKWEAGRVKALERYAISKSVFTFIAPNDQHSIQEEIGFKDGAFRNTYHLGNDGLLDLPKIDLKANEKEVFYAGTLDWEPNRDGLSWFLRECWPKVKNLCPEAKLNICGKGADEALKVIMRNHKDVHYHGFVEDLDEIMKKSRCAIVPLRFGSGMKIKTFDAFYRGLPLVTTSIGAEGIDVLNKKHALIVNKAEEFAQAVSETLNNVDQSTTMRDQAKHLCTERYTYKTLFSQMDEDIKKILET